MTQLPKSFADTQVCIIGLGYVGLTLSIIMAESGFKVSGIEINDEVLDSIYQGRPHFFEPGLAERLDSVIKNERLTCSKRISEGHAATVYIITVGTPLNADKVVNLDMIRSVAEQIATNLRANDIVIMRSTVKLGTTRDTVRPLLEKANVPFDLAFCPERTVEGNALNELRQLPQIVGGITLESAVRAGQIFQFITPTVIRVSDVETAEFIKMVDNTYRDITLAYSNEIARIADAIGISAIEVVNAGTRGYKRVHLAVPGPVGGPCLEKDPHILAQSLAPYGIVPEIAMAARTVNERQPEEVVQYLSGQVRQTPNMPDKPIIALLGIAFKGVPETDDLRGTMAKPIFKTIKTQFPEAEYRGYDPVVSSQQIRNFGLKPFDTLTDTLRNANLVLILNNHRKFGDMVLENVSNILGKPCLVYDFWNNFLAGELNLPEGVGYMALGSHKKSLKPYR